MDMISLYITAVRTRRVGRWFELLAAVWWLILVLVFVVLLGFSMVAARGSFWL